MPSFQKYTLNHKSKQIPTLYDGQGGQSYDQLEQARKTIYEAK